MFNLLTKRYSLHNRSESESFKNRSFISKAYHEPYVNYATKVMLGEKKVAILTLIQHMKDMQ